MYLFYSTAKKLINIITEPLKHDTFYFGDEEYTNQLNREGEQLSTNKEFRKPKAIRGNRDAIYLHRTFFGMYAILYQLKATVKMDKSFLEDLVS
ncbi:MAG: hypothetical protein H6553_05695 [Chitinophagales bacterium]|nr:hypothetical protein [Chitinophagales bacterium]